ncbi:MAG: ribosome silencing factor [Bacteroidales bacterium]|nr:ribosome silencing factor [Candidatus Scybalousia scybalohippi]MCQ2326094.1 ribosome silencing factor [Bacteroidales bacterium]
MTKDKKVAKMLAEVAVSAIQDKIGKDVTMIDFNGVKGSLFDYYVICTANSPSHADALAEKVEEEIYKNLKMKPNRREGLRNCEWVLLDYFDVIIHIFLKETREFYNIESMWNDVKQIHYEDVN